MDGKIKTMDISSLQKIIDALPLSVQIIGENGVCLDCNATTYAMFRAKTMDDVIGKPLSLFSPEKQSDGTSSQAGFAGQINQAFLGEEKIFEWESRRLDGEVFPSKVTLQKIEYEGQTCLMATIADNTDVVALREKSEFIIAHAPIPIVDVRPDLSIQSGNEAFSSLIGKTVSELLKMKISDFDVRNRVGGSLADGIEKKNTVNGELDAFVSSGVKHLQYYYTPYFGHNGKLLSVFAYYIDKTAEKAAVRDIITLTERSQAGNLDARLDPALYSGELRLLMEGINGTLDAIIDPLNVAANYVDRIAKGDLPPLITEEYNGDFNRIKDNLNNCIDSLNRLLRDTTKMYEEQKAGDIDAFIDLSTYKGFYREITSGYNEAVRLHVQTILKVLSILSSYSDGDFSPVLERLPGKQYIANEKLDQLRANIMALIEDCNQLTKAAVEGRLDTRADVTKHKGDYRRIVEGLNNTLQAVVQPLRDAGQILERMAVNDHTQTMTVQNYSGEYRRLAETVNLVRDRLIVATDLAKDVAIGNTEKLAEIKKIGRRSEQDELLPAFITCMENVQRLIDDTNMLTRSFIEGNLTARADSKMHQGEYRRIIEGINKTLDSVLTPVQEAIRVANEYAKANFSARFDPRLTVTGDWSGFKAALDNIGIQICESIGAINKQILELASNMEEATASIEEVSAGSQQIAKNAGKVSTNAEQGNDGINQILKAMEDLTLTVGEVSQRAEKVSSSATEANLFSKEGIDLAKKSESAMHGITGSTNEVDLIVKEINKQMEEIGKIVRLITDISNQTNLLALNAAIEAARAGEAGRGFAVVAAEVKSLAQDSRASAENIADMIANLQSKATKANDAIIQAGNAVEDGNRALKETVDAFKKIAGSIEDITRNAVDMASSSEEQAASVEEITASVNELSLLLQGTAREAQDAAAATEEASASIEQIGRVIANVSGIADTISRDMTKFKI